MLKKFHRDSFEVSDEDEEGGFGGSGDGLVGEIRLPGPGTNHQLYYEVRRRTLIRLLIVLGIAILVVGLAVGVTFYAFPNDTAGNNPYEPPSNSTSTSTTTPTMTPTMTPTPTNSSPPSYPHSPPPSSSGTGSSGITSGVYVPFLFLNGSQFFEAVDFFTADDPTNGYVNYVSEEQAWSEGLVKLLPPISTNGVSTTPVFIGCDNRTVLTNVSSSESASSSDSDSGSGSGSSRTGVRGRDSVRITSKQGLQPNTLFVLDLQHMPSGCTTWPSWWLVGEDWPNGGEVDIIEGINLNTHNQMTLHTSDGCTMVSEMDDGNGSAFLGSWSEFSGVPATNCYINASNQPFNMGCPIAFTNNTYGAPLNAIGGGIFAVEWFLDPVDQSGFIRGFFFDHEHVPEDLLQDKPEPSSWGLPQAYFALGAPSSNDNLLGTVEPNCPADHFKNLSIVFDDTFCGDWAGAVYPTSSCAQQYGKSCVAAVQNNPSMFDEAYWIINYLKIFTLADSL